MPTFPPAEEQIAVILRGTAQVERLDELRKKVERSRETGRPLRAKLGIDPTGFDVHLGHTVVLRKLRQFQDLGHQVVLIIGTATAAVGDPSGRDKSREGLTPEQIEKNAETYLAQIAKVIDVKRAEVVRNGDWFDRFTFAEVQRLLGHMTVQRMLDREDFCTRMTLRTPIYLHECLYPLMQGHDSVEIRADVELGGTEQLFNLMVGRDLQRVAGQEPQICITMPILRGLDGVKKMGKSDKNYIGLAESAKEQFFKVMQIPDEIMREWYELLTDIPAAEIATLTDPAKTHPKAAKQRLGREIVAFYHGAAGAEQARADWEREVKEKHDPDDMPEVAVSRAKVAMASGKAGVAKLLVAAGLAKSNNEARQKITEGAANVGPERTKISDPKSEIDLTDGLVVRLGKKTVRVRFVD